MTSDITTPNTTTPANLKAMIEHDELLVAVDFAKRLPDGHPDRMLVEEHSGHIVSPEAYRDYYRTMRGEPCPEEHVFHRHEQIKRFSVIRKKIVERGHKTVLDLGCLDGWQLLNLAATGVRGVGVDLCPEALAVGRERAAKWGFDLLFIEAPIEMFDWTPEPRGSTADGLVPGWWTAVEKFDAVILSEVLEHVLDPVACFRTAVKHLAPGGIVYASVPATPIPHHGKIEDAREHLRIYTEDDLVGLAKEAGLAKIVDHAMIEEQDEGEKFANRTISFRRATATIYCNHVTGGWSPERLDELGGSEEMVVKVAEAWAAHGYEVTVHQNGFVPTDALLRDHRGVRYRSRSISPAANQDLLVLFKGLDHLGVPAGRTVFWTTDLPADGVSAAFLPPAQAGRLDAVLCISEYHRTELLKACPWLDPTTVKAHWLGIDLDEIAGAVAEYPKVPKRVLYASSPDRGLSLLLEAWQKIREAIPDATLHVVYGFDFWKRSEAVVPAPVAESMRQERMRLENLLVQPGIVFKRRLPRREFLRELAEAEVWAYPCTGGELCCKVALEAQVANCYPVVVPTMALQETVLKGVISSLDPERLACDVSHALRQQFDGCQYGSQFFDRTAGHPIPSWTDLATWAWTVSGVGEVRQEPTHAGDRLVEEAIPAPAIEPEQFVIPSRVAVPPTGLDLLFMVNGMPFDGNTDREKSLGGCVTGDTLIDIPRDLKRDPGGIPITEVCKRIAEGKTVYVYSYDHRKGRIVLLPIRRAWRTKKAAEVWEVTYRWTSPEGDERVDSLRATPDHRVMLRNGTYKPLMALVAGDSLMPFNRYVGPRKNSRYFRVDLNNGEFAYEHRLTVSELGILYKPKRGVTGDVIHHKNFCWYDNSCENLQVLDWKEHLDIHKGGNIAFRKWFDNLTPQEYQEFCEKQRALSQTRWDALTPKQRQAANARPLRALQQWNSNPANMQMKAAKISAANKIAFAKPHLYALLVANGKKNGGWNKGREYTEAALANIRTGHRSLEARAAKSAGVKATWARYSPEQREARSEKVRHPRWVTVRNHTVVSTRRLDQRADVYDLEVPGTHNFVANGIVIHNSETAAIQLCRELAKRGHRVTIFSNLPGQPGKFDGVGYLPIQEWGRYAGSTPHDVSIIQRDPSPVSMPLASKMNVIWCHDLGLLRYRLRFRAALWNVDYLAPVSHWHGAQLKAVYDLPSAVIAPMRNGIELSAIQRSLDHKVPRDRKALVYAARPERGLDLLLQTVFPRLLERDPKLTLYIAGYDNTVPEMRDFYAHCQQLIANLGQRAKWMGHLKKAELYALYSRARCYVYPTRGFSEVSCITAMEAAACGLPFVASTLGALPETTSRVPGFARLVEHTGQADEAYISRFVEAAWEVLSDDLLNKRMSEAGRAGAEAYSWVEVAKEWEDFLLGALEVRSASKVRLARHWWRIGDLRGVELALKHNGEEPLVRDLAEKLRGVEDDEPPAPQRNVLEAMAQMASEAKPKTILGIGPQMAEAARAVAGMLGVRAVTEPPADFVFGVETLDCAADPSFHIREAEALAAPGGMVCLAIAGVGTYQDRVHQATMATHRRTSERRRRWVFDNHDLRDLLGKRPDLLAMVVGGGAASEYDGVPTAWSLFRFRANNGPVGELNVARRLWLQAPRMSLSGCLIVKNAEDMLHRCLKSILPYCDEVIVDDNGSTDSTFEVLAQYGIIPEKGPSPIDMGFDAARNANIARATGDMVLWIDADEALLDGRQLPKYLRQNFFNGYGIAQHHFSAVPPNAFKPDMPVRLYRRLHVDGTPTGIRFFGCLAGETPISTPLGPKPIEDLVGTRPWVYCYDHSKQRIGLARANWVGKTRRNIKVLEIELDDGTMIRATEEHPFLLRKAWKNVEPGAYVPAKDLKPGDRLMPFYRWQDGRKIGTPRGWMVALRGTALQQDEHRFVYEEVVGPIPPKHDVHHADENPANNDPSNLEALPEGDHMRLHHLGAKRSDETRRRVSENHAPCDGPNNSMWGRVHSTETRQKIGEKSRARGAGYGNSERGWFTASRVRRLNKRTWADPGIRARRIAGIKAAIVQRQAATIPSNNHKIASVRDGGFADVYNIEMPGPNHNFVAGGVVVHNCVHEHPELGINQSVGPSIVVSDVHIAHDGYLTETGRRKRFERNIPLMMRDRAAYPDRLLGKFLMVRDWVHLARYELERNGRRLTPQAAAYLESAVEAYRKDFLGRTHMMAMDGLAYYNEALQHLGRGFETQAVVKVGGLDGMSHDFTYSGRVASQEDLQAMLGGASRDLTEVWKGDYV